MKTNYEFHNLLGQVYSQGNISFSRDGSLLYSPVGNRISCFDLVQNKSMTYPSQNTKNVSCFDVSSSLMLSIDEDGRGILVHLQRKTVLHRISFKSKVFAVKFSPCGTFVAVALQHKNSVQIWKLTQFATSQQDDQVLEFTPFSLHHQHTGHHDTVTSLQWSPNGAYFLTCSYDMTMRLYTRDAVEGYRPIVLSGHKDVIVGAYWNTELDGFYSVGRDGSLFRWSIVNGAGQSAQFEPTQSQVKLVERLYFNQKDEYGPSKVKSADFRGNLLVVGFQSGVFSIYSMPNFDLVQTLSISQKKIDTLQISPNGDWLGFASSTMGQLLVWEWQSETYVMKQQGHYHDINSVAYSNNGTVMASGGDDGKVKIWNVDNGFCFVTFAEHSGPVTQVAFAGGKQAGGGKQSVLFSASKDGTVRAFDLIRYRNFKTFTSPAPAQFSALAVDPSGDIVCAGSLDTYEIYLWSVQTGTLLDILSGHEGPISSLAFSPEGAVSQLQNALLISGSWDQTAKLWDVYARGSSTKCMETMKHKSDVLAVAISPSGGELCTATLDGQLAFWDTKDGTPSTRTALIEGRRDIAGGRKSTDMRTAANNSSDKHFNSIAYTADGDSILAGGNSKFICLYDLTSNGVLLKKFQLSSNLSLDGMMEKLNSKNMTVAGAVDLNDSGSETSDVDDRVAIRKSLPGAQKGDRSNVRKAVRCKSLQFNPTGQSFAIATTEGLVEFALSKGLIFDPTDLDMNVTPQAIINLVQELKSGVSAGSWTMALVQAMRLNEQNLMQMVYESIPVPDLELIVQSLPVVYVPQLLQLVTSLLDSRTSPHLEFHLMVLVQVLKQHGPLIKSTPQLQVILRAVKRSVTLKQDRLSKVTQENIYTIKYLKTFANQISPVESII